MITRLLPALLLAAAPSSSRVLHADDKSVPAAYDGYELVWSDEFDTVGPLDPESWTYERGFVRNNELQWYQSENARCAGGTLVIEGRRERVPNPRYSEGARDWKQRREFAEYTSASVTTRGLHEWTYGRFEMRGRIDVRDGLWPAFWTLGTRRRWPACGEIDIMEYYDGVLLANACWSSGRRFVAEWDDFKKPIREFADPDWAKKFHVWRMDWDEDRIELSVDGEVLNTIDVETSYNRDADKTNPFREPHSMILNLAIGGTRGGDPSKTEFPARFEVDWVRVYREKPDAASEARFWLENMAVHHGYTDEEIAAVMKVDAAAVPALLETHDIERGAAPAPTEGLRVLPYPGGRHPRIGFLEGAIDPHRDTKVSVFAPWEGGGYVVVDLPEALWCQHGLTYLAHTHIPTMWDQRGVTLERFDWTRKADGVLESRRVLPNKLAFTARVVPRGETVDMELALDNGSTETLTGLRTQICVLLKGAPAFNALTNDNKTILENAVAVKASEEDRWIVTAWERARPWNNERCPCMHSDPVFPDLAPGDKATVRGRLFFWEGEDVAAEIARRREAGTLVGRPRD